MTRTLTLLALSVAACGTSVSPVDGNPLLDGSTQFDASFEHDADPSSPNLCLPLRPCGGASGQRCDEGSVCGHCISLQAFNAPLRDRSLGAACVQRQPNEPPFGGGLLGAIGCDEPWYVAFINDDYSESICLRREECAALYNAYIGGLRPGEQSLRCRFSDYTFASTQPITGAFAFCDRSLGICTHEANCRCPSGQVCAFASERIATGICVPPTVFLQNISLPCRAMPDRHPCPAGQSCLFPRRGDINIPDRERWGVCIPKERCEAIPRALPRFDPWFYCDTSLESLDGGR